MASIGNSKAMIGTLFLQYSAYAVFYVLDEAFGMAPSHYKKLISDEESEAKEKPFSEIQLEKQKTQKEKRSLKLEGGDFEYEGGDKKDKSSKNKDK